MNKMNRLIILILKLNLLFINNNFLVLNIFEWNYSVNYFIIRFCNNMGKYKSKKYEINIRNE